MRLGAETSDRSWDDYLNQKYTENAWVHGALLQDILPVYGIVGLGATIIDVLILNPVKFWGDDAWDNVGTGFVHEPLQNAPKTVEKP